MTADGRRGAGGAEVEAQAKLNLRLRVLAREAGGYHQLETLFLRVALADTVRVRRSLARTLDVAGGAPGTDLGPVERNLAWRAATAYADAAGWQGGFAIELEKRIPVGGGMGGGSADAGGVLRVMESLASAPIGTPALLRIAASLGADVPFLASEQAYALAWGRGERMLTLEPPERRAVTLLVPPFGVNTLEAFGWLAAAREGAARGGDAELLRIDALSDWERIQPLAGNDFEPVVAARHPVIAQLVATLRETGCALAMMSGSGSVVFGVHPRGASHTSNGRAGDDSSPVRYIRISTSTADRVEPVRRLD